MHCFYNKSCELQSTVGLFHLSEDLPPVRHMKQCRSKTLDSLCLLFLITYDQTFPAFSVCDDLARGSDCWLYLKPPWPTRQQLGTHRRSTAETHERTWRLIWLLQWLALHQTGSNCEVDVRRQTEAGGKAQAAWQQARLEGGSLEHADLLLMLIIGRLFLCLPVGVFKKKPQCHCASCQESTYLGFNGAHVGTFFLSAQQFYWENQLTKANGNTFLGFFPLWWL